MSEQEKTQEQIEAEAAQEVEAAAAAAAEKAQKAAAAAEKRAAAKDASKGGKDLKAKSYRLCCTTRVTGTLFDTKRNVRIPAAGNGDVKVEGPIPAGSWLGSQITAGLVQIVE